jgi:hypothetical protein
MTNRFRIHGTLGKRLEEFLGGALNDERAEARAAFGVNYILLVQSIFPIVSGDCGDLFGEVIRG